MYALSVIRRLYIFSHPKRYALLCIVIVIFHSLTNNWKKLNSRISLLDVYNEDKELELFILQSETNFYESKLQDSFIEQQSIGENGEEKKDWSHNSFIASNNVLSDKEAVDTQPTDSLYCPKCIFNVETMGLLTCEERANYFMSRYNTPETKARIAVINASNNCQIRKDIFTFIDNISATYQDSSRRFCPECISSHNGKATICVELFQNIVVGSNMTMEQALETVMKTTDNCSTKPTNTLVPIETDIMFCKANNFIMSGVGKIEKTTNNSAAFSIQTQDFQIHYPQSCKSTSELLGAIQNGSRQWDITDGDMKDISILKREKIPSTFVPSGCNIPLYSPDDICEVLNRFSHVIIQGDSLSRHTHGGLLMALRNDLIEGSIITSDLNMAKCTCDSQFSEAKQCRRNSGLYNKFKPHQLGLCPKLEKETQFQSVFNINRLHRGVYDFAGVNCTSPDSKGVLVIVQGGVQMRYNADSTYGNLLAKFFQNPIFQNCAQQKKAIFIWNGYHPQSPIYDNKYEDQKLANGLVFNKKMSEKIQASGAKNITTVNWINFLTGAMHTDGLHFAAQANYFKAQYLVALTDIMWKEKMFVSSH